MYVTQRDIDVLSDMIGQVQNAIEGGAEDTEYWFALKRDADKLFKKACKQKGKQDARRKRTNVR